MLQVRLNSHATIRLAGTHWDELELVVGTGANRREAALHDPKLVTWLLSMRRPMDRGAAIELGIDLLKMDRARVGELLSSLIDNGAIVDAGREESAATQAAMDRWIRWGWRDALDYHLAVRDLPFATGDQDGTEQIHRFLGGILDAGDAGADEPTPPAYKEYPRAPHVPLPRSRELIDAAGFGAALHGRRTCRNFEGRMAGLTPFSELLEHAFGVTLELDMGRMGPHVTRTSPSGGARHPIEVYPIVLHVDGVEPGVYHYNTRDHALELIRAGNFADEVSRLGHLQSGLRGISAAFFFTARWDRHMWKYRYARSYRMVLFDTAHLVQTSLLTATALGFRTFLTPAIKDSEVLRFLDLADDLAESPLYLTSIG
jgi:SagB-type dehydrogenase family enzyme